MLRRERVAWCSKGGQGPTRTANGHLKLVVAGVPVNQMGRVEAVHVDFDGLGEVGLGSHQLG